jgi:hypothetical protein
MKKCSSEMHQFELADPVCIVPCSHKKISLEFVVCGIGEPPEGFE